MIRDPLTVHQSDPGCLALLKAKADGLDESGEAAKVGTATHAAAEDLCYRGNVGGDFDPMPVVVNAINRVARETSMAPESVSSALGIMEKCVSGDDMLRFFHDDTASATHPEWTWWLDQHFAPMVVGNGVPAYAGTMDQLIVYEDRLRVVDFKSVLARPAQWELHDNWQARVYSLAALAHFPNINRVAFRLVLLRHRYTIEEEFVRGAPWEASTRARLRYQRRQRLTAEDSGDWPERLGTDCKWCPLIHKCGAMEEARQMGKEDELDPSELARRSVALKGLATKLEKRARDLVETTGPIPMGDGSALGDKPTQKWVLTHDDATTLAKLRGLGMKWDDETQWFSKGVTAASVRGFLRSHLGREFKAYMEEGSDPVVEPTTKLQHSVWWPEGRGAKAT